MKLELEVSEALAPWAAERHTTPEAIITAFLADLMAAPDAGAGWDATRLARLWFAQHVRERDPETYGSPKEARRGIYEQFRVALGSLPDDVLAAIDTILSETLNRREVYRRVQELFKPYDIRGS